MCFIQPADNIAYFLGEIFRSTRANGGKPDMFVAAYLLHKYRSEFAMLNIPGFAVRFVFPVLRMLGHLTGRFKELEHGPAPLP